MYVILSGKHNQKTLVPIVYGPFATEALAAKYSDNVFHGDNWQIIKLDEPLLGALPIIDGDRERLMLAGSLLPYIGGDDAELEHKVFLHYVADRILSDITGMPKIEGA